MPSKGCRSPFAQITEEQDEEEIVQGDKLWLVNPNSLQLHLAALVHEKPDVLLATETKLFRSGQKAIEGELGQTWRMAWGAPVDGKRGKSEDGANRGVAALCRKPIIVTTFEI